MNIADGGNERYTTTLHEFGRGGKRSAFAVELQPYELHDEVPVVVSPGLGIRNVEMTQTLHQLALAGRHVLAVEHARSPGRHLSPEWSEAIEQYPKSQIHKAAALAQFATRQTFQQVDVIGYCEGAVNGAIFAEHYPGLVRNYIAINPASMTGPADTFSRVAKKFIKKSIKDITVTAPTHFLRGEYSDAQTRMTLARNRIQSLGTLKDLSEVSLGGLLSTLQDQGTSVNVFQSYSDTLYPYELVADNVPEGINSHSSLLPKSLGHAAFIKYPEITIHAIQPSLGAPMTYRHYTDLLPPNSLDQQYS